MSQTGGSIARLVEQLLKELGEDAYREGLEHTPERVEKALRFLTAGYRMNIADVFNEALFVEEYDEMVVVKDIDFFSLCEHHLIPFFGKAHIAYMPHKKIVGLSKIRETATFGGVPIAENRDQLKCGVGVVDLTTGRNVAHLEFQTGVPRELVDTR